MFRLTEETGLTTLITAEVLDSLIREDDFYGTDTLEYAE